MKTLYLLLASAVLGCAGFVGLGAVAAGRPASLVANTVDNLGMLYGASLMTTGTFAILVALQRGRGPQVVRGSAAGRWLVFLPAVVGLIGVAHGYVNLASYAPALRSDIMMPHHTVWATATVGSLFTVAATVILFAGMRDGPSPSKSSS